MSVTGYPQYFRQNIWAVPQRWIRKNPDLPFVSGIVGGLFAGRAIVISGMVLPTFASNEKRFHIDLCCGLLIDGDHMDNKALHINPRFEQAGGWFSSTPDRDLVLNSYISGSWGSEERFPNPFEEGKPFQLRILIFEKYFKVSANGKHICDYAYRVPIEQVKTILVKGNIRVDFIEFQPPIGKGVDGLPVVAPISKRPEQITRIDRPTIPFRIPLPPGGFATPQRVKFTVTPFLSGERFTLNLLSKGEYFFHFRVDLPNAANKMKTEERQFGKFPFNKGITHDIQFAAYGSSVAVDVDGMPFVKFVYREGDDPARIDEILVDGQLILHRFEHAS